MGSALIDMFSTVILAWLLFFRRILRNGTTVFSLNDILNASGICVCRFDELLFALLYNLQHVCVCIVMREYHPFLLLLLLLATIKESVSF